MSLEPKNLITIKYPEDDIGLKIVIMGMKPESIIVERYTRGEPIIRFSPPLPEDDESQPTISADEYPGDSIPSDVAKYELDVELDEIARLRRLHAEAEDYTYEEMIASARPSLS